MNGIYVHIPYCVKKCGYCDFYSVCDLTSADGYTGAVCQHIMQVDEISDTLYIGGGTPSLLGADRLSQIISCAKPILTDDAEITVEVNPGDDMSDLLPKLAKVGINRLSIGMQSHNDDELKLLTRRHNANDVENTVNIAKGCGITNISLDVMLGIEGQTVATLKDTLDFCAKVGATHISAYMLKIEEGTPFEKATFRPVDDVQADMYLFAVDYLSKLGYKQYEISNFCLADKYSRHNIKYWTNQSYIGIGAAAHSYYNGRRSYYSRSVSDFINGLPAVDDGAGGGFEETVMLRLRLSDGVDLNALSKEYPDMRDRLEMIKAKAHNLSKTDLLTINGDNVALTPKGFLVSNSIINLILE